MNGDKKSLRSITDPSGRPLNWIFRRRNEPTDDNQMPDLKSLDKDVQEPQGR